MKDAPPAWLPGKGREMAGHSLIGGEHEFAMAEDHRSRQRGNRLSRSAIWACILVLGSILSVRCGSPEEGEQGAKPAQTPAASAKALEGAFKGFKTNTAKSLIDANLIAGGGAGKDAIPAIDRPRFLPAGKTEGIPNRTRGILVEIKGERRFYPVSILVWHQIVNDSIHGRDIAVTYCPLSGSAIVFDRKVNGKTLRFGFSGRLFEANMLMYDDQTESFWSQSRREAVVGDYAGTKLEIVPMQMLTIAQVRAHYPDTLVLTQNTGHERDYSQNPYEGDEQDEMLYQIVSVRDGRHPPKTLMYVVPVGDRSAAFPVLQLLLEDEATLKVADREVRVTTKGDEVFAFVDGESTPGYYEMWFSWAAQHFTGGVVWKAPEQPEELSRTRMKSPRPS
jgi:hypothetical protein